eukprot:6576923-Alexandrium_andersonii.AAC.1
MPRMPVFFRRLGGGPATPPPNQIVAIAKNSGGRLGDPHETLLLPNAKNAMIFRRPRSAELVGPSAPSPKNL